MPESHSSFTLTDNLTKESIFQYLILWSRLETCCEAELSVCSYCNDNIGTKLNIYSVS